MADNMSCAHCVHSVPNKNLPIGTRECRPLPPTVHLLPQQTVQGVTMTVQSMHPPVSLDHFCGEFDDGADEETIQ